MKKVFNIFISLIFLSYSIFLISGVEARDLNIRKDTEFYEYYWKSTDDKLVMSISDNEIFTKAIDQFYKEPTNVERADVLPLEFTVKDGNTWDSNSDVATMYINIPALFDVEKKESQIYLVRIKQKNDELILTAYDIGSTYEHTYSIKNKSNIENEIKSLNSKLSLGSVNGVDSYLSDQFAVLTTSDFNSTGTTYYMLVVCNSNFKFTTSTSSTTKSTTSSTTKSTTSSTTKSTTSSTTKSTTKSTTSSTTSSTTKSTTQPTSSSTTIPSTSNTTTTTTIENPKTADTRSQLYVVIGVMSLVGIIGLGIKFAKSSK